MMAASLHIHVLEGITEDDIAAYKSSEFGSKYYRSVRDEDQWEVALHRVADTPNIWVGEVSWLQAMFLGDTETYVPKTLERICEIIGEDLPVIDDKLIADIVAAFGEENLTCYELADVDSVREFLEQHKGKQVFTINW